VKTDRKSLRARFRGRKKSGSKMQSNGKEWEKKSGAGARKESELVRGPKKRMRACREIGSRPQIDGKSLKNNRGKRKRIYRIIGRARDS